jgi:regulator of protease activity HflC (stomatin/prohibitin superfamily)
MFDNLYLLDIFTWIIIPIIIILIIIQSIKIIPQKTAYIVERFGKYNKTLEAGLHFIIPIVDRISYVHTLKEQAIDVPHQTCITKDNIAVEVDGILYMQLIDPCKASYGISNYKFASIQLVQTTMRSIVGKLELDKTFEERETINKSIVDAIDKASDAWGIKITRYEVKNIIPPQSIKDAMEKQMRAEREKRAVIAESEGERQSKINRAEGERQSRIMLSEGDKQSKINIAEGKSVEIYKIAQATSEGIEVIAQAINKKSGIQAVNLRVAETYLSEFGKLAKTNNSMIIPTDLANVAGIVKAITKVIKDEQEKEEDK